MNNDTTQPTNMQSPTGDNLKGANEAAASLALATHLSQSMMQGKHPAEQSNSMEQPTDQPVEGDNSPESAPTGEETPQPKEDAKPEEDTKLGDLEATLTKALDDVKAEFEKTRKEDAQGHEKELLEIHKLLKDLNAK